MLWPTELQGRAEQHTGSAENPPTALAEPAKKLTVTGRESAHASSSHSDRPARSCRWKGSRFTMATVTYDKASRIYPGSDRPAVNELNLEIGDGEFLVLVGPSGCGKSTSLRMLAGLEDVDRGRILIEGKDVTNLPPKSRDIAMVFQNYALYPHMSVYENMAFALKLRKTSKTGDRPPGQGGRAAPAARRVPGPQAEGALRWSASACRHGPRDRPRAAGVPHGRAAVEPRRQAPRPDPFADRHAAGQARHHHRLRDPRPGRGHDDGPPGGGHARRRAAAVRHPAGAVRHPRQRLRRRLHRLPGHEHQDGRADRVGRRVRRAGRAADPRAVAAARRAATAR